MIQNFFSGNDIRYTKVKTEGFVYYIPVGATINSFESSALFQLSKYVIDLKTNNVTKGANDFVYGAQIASIESLLDRLISEKKEVAKRDRIGMNDISGTGTYHSVQG